MTPAAPRDQILASVAQYHAEAFPERPFVPGETPVPCAGRSFDADELVHLVDASLDFWLTGGRYAERFEHEFARFVGVRHAVLCNSGSSANLLAVAALTSPKLGERRLRPGDEVVTVAAAFPTTVFPLIQYGLVPVFVDVELSTYNAIPDRIAEAITPAHPRHHARPYARQSVRSRPHRRAGTPLQSVAHRRQLRRTRFHMARTTDRNVRRSGDRKLLPGPSHHHGRRGLRAYRSAAAQDHCRVFPRLGSRLLVPYRHR